MAAFKCCVCLIDLLESYHKESSTRALHEMKFPPEEWLHGDRLAFKN